AFLRRAVLRRDGGQGDPVLQSLHRRRMVLGQSGFHIREVIRGQGDAGRDGQRGRRGTAKEERAPEGAIECQSRHLRIPHVPRRTRTTKRRDQGMDRGGKASCVKRSLGETSSVGQRVRSPCSLPPRWPLVAV